MFFHLIIVYCRGINGTKPKNRMLLMLVGFIVEINFDLCKGSSSVDIDESHCIFHFNTEFKILRKDFCIMVFNHIT